MKRPDYQAAIAHARRRMSRELPQYLVYHNFDHTFNEVLPAAVQLAELSHLPADHMGLIAIGAAYHDIGWVKQGLNHEAIGAEIARHTLPNFGFNEDQIGHITGMIMATKLPQSPHNLLEEIVVDADLDVLGRVDFFPRNLDLRSEISNNGNRPSDLEWFRIQLKFVESHTYFTAAARLLRDEQKQKNVAELKRRIELLVEEDNA